jgi:hypothetical protein
MNINDLTTTSTINTSSAAAGAAPVTTGASAAAPAVPAAAGMPAAVEALQRNNTSNVSIAPAVVPNNDAAVTLDINTILRQLKNVETDREQLMQTVKELQGKVGKLTEGKKAEMQKTLDTVINQWLSESVNDEEVREEFKKGMSRLVDQTAEDSGVWRVVCCASNLHAERLRQLEEMRIQMDNLKKTHNIVTDTNNFLSNMSGGATFIDENNRKRPIDQISDGNTTNRENLNIWEEFAMNMKGRTFEGVL